MNIVFAGTPEFAAQHLQGLLAHGISISRVISQPDKPGKRGKKLVPTPVKVAAEDHGITVIQPKKLAVDDITPLQADLLIVVAYGQILRQNLLDAPTFGCINVHGSLLPRWRGAAPIQRAIEAGDTETGVCIMKMDAGLDTGPVYLEMKTDIQPTDTSGDVSQRLVKLGVEGLIQVIGQLEDGSAHAIPQVEDGATYAKKILKSEALIDWSQPAEQIRNQIHAFNPDPICFSSLDHEGKSLRVKFIRAAQILKRTEERTPGEIIGVSRDGILIATGSDDLFIEKLQLPLGKGSILSGQDILNSRSDIVFPGAKFE